MIIVGLLRKIGFLLSSKGKHKAPKSVLRRLFRFAHGEVTISDFDGGLSLKLNLEEHMQRRIFWMGYYSEDIVSVMKRILKPDMIVVDVGANIGEITLVAANCVGEEGAVIAFEPIGRLAEALEQHVEINKLDQVLVVREALGDAVAESAPIYTSCGQNVPDVHHGLGSLYGDSSNQEPIQFIRVNTLDIWVSESQLTRLDLLKIDIEGAELACLHGAEATLRRLRPKIVVEIQDFSAARAGYKAKDILDYLDSLGYNFYKIEKAGRLSALSIAGLCDYQNVLCVPRDAEVNIL